MANKYLNDTGLQYFYNKLKTIFQLQESGKGLSTNDYTTTEKTKLSGIATGAEVNQNAFSNVKVGSTTVAADAKTDTLTLVAGSNVTITPDASNDKITIAASGVTVDSALSDTSTNPVQNKIIKEKFDGYNGEMKGAIPTNTDLNNVKDVGMWFCTGEYTYTNIPDSQTWGFLSVEKSGGTITVIRQIFENATGLWYRNFTSNTWGAWVRYATKSAVDAKANLASPTFTGTPKAPTATAGTNTTQIATTAFVKTAVDTAVAGITEFDIQVVTALPDTGVKGTIYLLSHSHGTGDVYDEYIWTGSGYEKIGNTDIDLSDYLKKTDMVAITTSEIDTLFA